MRERSLPLPIATRECALLFGAAILLARSRRRDHLLLLGNQEVLPTTLGQRQPHPQREKGQLPVSVILSNVSALTRIGILG